MQRPAAPAPTPSPALALALAAAAGFVDVFGYLVYGHVLVSHMSGNTAMGAARLAQGHLAEAAHRLAPLPAFVVGVAVGAVAARSAARRGVRRRLAVVLGIELVPLVAYLVVRAATHADGAVTSALLCAAMGVQNAAARHVAGQDVRTTFVTGMIVTAVDDLVAWLRRDERDARTGGLPAAIWAAFFVGGLLGGVGSARFGPAALLAPLAALAAFAASDALRRQG